MPRPLAYFNNSVDPYLQSTALLKPELYFFDEYQSYDLVFVDHISNIVWNALRGIQYLPVVEGGILFERFTPIEYPWCDEYSTKYYNFLKKYSGTGFYTHHVNGKGGNNFMVQADWMITTIDWHENPSALINYLPSGFVPIVNPITLTLPATSTPELITITWLRANEGDDIAWDKDYRVFQTTTEPQSVHIDLHHLAACSVVVSSTAHSSSVIHVIKTAFDAISSYYLFDNLDILFQSINNTIDAAYPRLRQIVVSYTFTPHYASADYQNIPGGYNVAAIPIATIFTNAHSQPFTRFLNESGLLGNSGWGQEDRRSMSVDDTDLINIPSWLQFHAITYANNNFWNKGILPPPDTGTKWYFYGGGTTPQLIPDRDVFIPPLNTVDVHLAGINTLTRLITHNYTLSSTPAVNATVDLNTFDPAYWNNYIGGSKPGNYLLDRNQITQFFNPPFPQSYSLGIDLTWDWHFRESTLGGAAAVLVDRAYPHISIGVQTDSTGIRAVMMEIYDIGDPAPIVNILDDQNGTLTGSNVFSDFSATLGTPPYFSMPYKIPLMLNSGIPTNLAPEISGVQYIDETDTYKHYA